MPTVSLRQVRFIYIDETWINVGRTTNRVWVESIKTAEQAMRCAPSVGMKKPSGKESQVIVMHCGNDNCFTQGAGEIFHAQKRHRRPK